MAAHLVQSGYTLEQISRAIHLLRVESVNPNRSPYENNRAVNPLHQICEAVSPLIAFWEK